MGFKNFVKNVGGEIKKASKKYNINRNLIIEAVQIKKGILVRLTLSDLRHMYRQFGGTKEYLGGEEDYLTGQKIPKRKITKYDYIEFLSKKPYGKLVMLMKSMGRVRLANDMEREVEYLQNKKGKEINGDKKEFEEDIVLDTYLNKIVEEITSIPKKSLKNEREYQIRLDGLLTGSLKYSFKKQKCRTITEYTTKSNRRIDILIQIGEYRIAVETKYNPRSSGEIQRAIGQSHGYSREGIDAYILVSYTPIESKIAIEDLRQLKESLQIPLKVIADSRLLKL
jgi:hypothetical protein